MNVKTITESFKAKDETTMLYEAGDSKEVTKEDKKDGPYTDPIHTVEKNRDDTKINKRKFSSFRSVEGCEKLELKLKELKMKYEKNAQKSITQCSGVNQHFPKSNVDYSSCGFEKALITEAGNHITEDINPEAEFLKKYVNLDKTTTLKDNSLSVSDEIDAEILLKRQEECNSKSSKSDVHEENNLNEITNVDNLFDMMTSDCKNVMSVRDTSFTDKNGDNEKDSYSMYSSPRSLNFKRKNNVSVNIEDRAYEYNVLFDWIQKCIMLSEKNPFAHHFLQSSESINREWYCQIVSNAWTIHPFSMFKFYWDIIIMIVVYITLLVEPIMLSFEFTTEKNLPDLAQLKYLLYVLLFILFLDILLNFNMGYYDRELKVVVLNRQSIVLNYLCCKFFTHLIFLIPWYIIATFQEKLSVMLTTEQIIRRDWFAVTSITRILRLAEIRDYFILFEKLTVQNKVYWQIAKLVIPITVLFNFAACLQLNVVSMSNLIYTDNINSNLTWMVLQNLTILYKGSVIGQYSACLQRACSSILLYGDGNRSNKTVEERTLASILRMTGIMLYVYLMTNLLYIIRGKYACNKKYENLISNYKELIRHKRVPADKMERILAYLEFKFDNKFCNEEKIMRLLSAQLGKEIRIHRSKSLIDKVFFFKDIPESVMSSIIDCLHFDTYLPGDNIIKVGKECDAMFFLISGTVAVYNKYGAEKSRLEDGAYFGEVSLLEENVARTVSMSAISCCNFQLLKAADFKRIVKPFPSLLKSMKELVITAVKEKADKNSHMPPLSIIEQIEQIELCNIMKN